MNQLIRRQHRILCGAVLLFVATCLCGLPMGFTAEAPAPPPAGQEPPALAPEASGPPPGAGEVQERAVPRGEILDLPGSQRPAARPPATGGEVIKGQAIVQASAPIGPPDPVAPVKELPIHLLITNARDASGNNVGVRGQIDRIIALVNANMAQQQSVRAKVSVESFTVFGAGMSATTYTDRPNHRFVHIPYMVGYKIYDVQKKVGGSWVSTGVTRHLSQSIRIQIFCDRWETGRGALKLATDIDRPYMEPNQGTLEQIVDFFLNGHLTDYIDSVVRQQIAAISLTNSSGSLGLDCNALGANQGIVGNPTDDVVLYSYQSGPSVPKGQAIFSQLSLTLQSIKRLPARNLQGQPLYAATETPRLEVFANQYLMNSQLPAMLEGQQVAITAPSITVPASGLTSLSVLVNVRQANGTQVDSATQVYGQNVNYGNGTKTIRVRKSYWTQANPQTGAKPQQHFVDAYELTFLIQAPGAVVADPTVGTGPTTGP